jgi:hypothetical protein
MAANVTKRLAEAYYIYEKDLGSRTAAIASAMTSFEPDDPWRRVTQAVQSASGRR